MSFRPNRTIVCTIGTRPEAIKMAPLVKLLRRIPSVRCRVLLTGQHGALVDQVLGFFGITPDIKLNAMRPRLTLDQLARFLVEAVSYVLGRERADLVLAQGDTTSVLAASMASFRLGVPFGHVEAGLRTHRLFAPFPEEANRIVATHLGALHFAPTVTAQENLEREGIAPRRIFVTGNTVIDALFATAGRDIPIGIDLDPLKRLVLVTAHRRESFGEPLRQICRAVQVLHDRHPDIELLWTVHPNPSVASVVADLMYGFPRVRLCRPLPYGSFVSAMKRSTLILTDSGGVQEEAPALGKPVLVMRSESERPEAVEAGVARLVGHDPQAIVEETSRLLRDPLEYHSMARGFSPYGDGRAARRIASIVRQFVGIADGAGASIPRRDPSAAQLDLGKQRRRLAGRGWCRHA
jgi:UDP-N-acetylglucosamine 2-epimerase (non-hydrolysing)